MKKFLALILVAVMAVAVCACKAKPAEETTVPEETEAPAVSEEDTQETEALPEETEEQTEELADETTEAVISDLAKHDADYWTELYGTNRCPFSIVRDGEETRYYFRDGGNLAFWVYTEENTDGWYINDGYIISADNSSAIKIEDMASFSSFCDYEALPYSGNTLSEEERAAQQTGVFYVLNSYTPVRTNWGVQIVTDEYTEDDIPGYTAYGLTDELKDQQWFTFYIEDINDYENLEEKASLWAFPHIDRSEYTEFLNDELAATGVKLGDFEYSEEDCATLINTYIPNENADGLAAGEVDLVVTFGSGEQTVIAGLVSVNTLAANS